MSTEIITDERAGLPSASSFNRLKACPGSVRMCLDCPPEPESALASDGTLIHNALAGEPVELAETEEEIAQRLTGMEQGAYHTWMQDRAEQTVPAIIREERFWIRDRKTLAPIASAKPDVVYVGKESALVLNYKTGFADQTPAEINWQGRVEVLSVWHDYPTLKTIRWGYLQHRLKSSMDFVEYSSIDLAHAERDLLFHIWNSNQPDAPRVPGSHCRYCPGKAYCAEAATWAMVVSAQSKEIVPTDKASAALYASKLTLAQAAKIHVRKTILEAVLDAIKDRLMAADGEQLAQVGMQRKPGAKKKEITDQQQARALLLSSLTDVDINNASSISRAKAAEVYAARYKTTKKAAAEKIDEMLVPVLLEKQNSPSIVPLSNVRTE